MSRAMQFDIVANDKASATMGKVDQSMARFSKGIASSFAGISARAMATIAAVQKVAQTINQLGDVADEAARLGVSVETYQKLKFAAEDYGSSVEEIAKAFKDVNKMLDEAATKKAGPGMETLRALGFSDQDIIERRVKQAEVMERLAEAIKGATTEEEKFAVASRVLGDKISQSMVPVLEDYTKFKSLMASTEAMSARSAQNLDRAGSELNKFFNFIKTTGGELAGMALEKMMPAEPQLAAPVSDTEKKRREGMAAAILKVGEKPADKSGARPGEVSSMAAIGGATFRGFTAPAAKSVEEQQLSELQAIAANTAPAGAPAPAPGSTNITSDDPLAGVVSRIYQSGATNPGNLERFRTMRPSR